MITALYWDSLAIKQIYKMSFLTLICLMLMRYICLLECSKTISIYLQEQYWIDGIALLAVASIGGLLNTYLIFRLPCSSGFADDSMLRLLSGIDLLLLYILVLRRIPLIFLESSFISNTFPYFLLYVPAIEKGLTCLASFFFLIFVGGRHLRQVVFENK